MENGSPDYAKLTTLHVNVVRWDTNEQWRIALTDLVDEKIRHNFPEFKPTDYDWSEFEHFLGRRFGYSCLEHAVVFAPHGVRDEGRAKEVFNAYVWRSILRDIAEDRELVAEASDLFFLVVPRHGHEAGEGNFATGFDIPHRIQLPTSIADIRDIPQVAEHVASDIESGAESNAETPKPYSPRPSIALQVPGYRLSPAVRSMLSAIPRFEIELDTFDPSEVDWDDTDSDVDCDCYIDEATAAVYRPVRPDEISRFKRVSPSFDTDSDYSDDEVAGTAATTPSPKSRAPESATRGSMPGVRGGRPSTLTVPTTPTKSSTRGGSARGRASTRGAQSTRGRLASVSRPAGPRAAGPSKTTKPTRPSPLSKTTLKNTTTPGPSSPAVNDIPASAYTDLVDIVKSEYQTTETADADYGAVDDTSGVIDTYLGSHNSGDSKPEWHACLEFFNINVGEYLKREAIAAGKLPVGGDNQRKRVPMKKLPGTTVGLFDYQLMGVFNLVRFVLNDVSGGLLCDEQGLGKTQEMYGLIAFAAALRRCKAEVKAAWRKKAAADKAGKGKGSPAQHHPPGTESARTCPFDERFGFRCYCYHPLTRELADRLPEGLNVVVVPARSCASMVRDAKTKLDVKQFKIRGCHDGGDKEDKLTPADVGALRATITATQGEAGPTFQYQAAPGSDYIIVVSPEFIPRLNGMFQVEVKGGAGKKSALLPGMILMDEFHEYAISKDEESRTVAWLQHLKKCCLDSQLPTPLTYFVSGTPFGDSPSDIRSAVSVLEKDAWQDEAHPLHGVTVSSFDDITQTFDKLTSVQASGEMVEIADILTYRRRLGSVLRHTMVRRLGTDQFQGRNLTDLGPLKVNITDHQLPLSLNDSLQALADQMREQAVAAAAAQGIPVARLLRSKAGEALLLKLRLASTFPGIGGPTGAAFTFTTSEIHAHLAAAKDDVTKTPYFRHLPAWSASSPKLETLTQTIRTMLADKSPIPGSATSIKKYCIFTPLEAEAVLIQSYLLLKLAQPKTTLKGLKPVFLHSAMPQSARQRVLDQFLTEGNAPPNVLVAPMALAGTGLNLQRAKYSTVTGPAWTKRENQQAYYRIHRVGQRQVTQLWLLTGRWNPAERVILAGYEGREVADGEEAWEVGNRFCESGQEEGGLVERHQTKRGEIAKPWWESD